MDMANPSGGDSQLGPPTAEGAEGVVRDFERYYLENFKLLNEAVAAIEQILKSSLDELKEELAIHDVSGRVKALESCIKKYNGKYHVKNEAEASTKPVSDLITDLIGVRIVCLYEDDIERISDKVQQIFEIVGKTDKIEAMNQNVDRFGYKALHYDLHLGAPRGALGEYRRFTKFNVELQIRTIFQDAWSVIDHQLKYKQKIHASLARRINVFAALCELADQEFMRIRDDIRAAPTDVAVEDAEKAVTFVTLDLRSFLEVLRNNFPAEVILPDQADILLATIKRLDGALTKETMVDMFTNWGVKLQGSYDAFKTRRHQTLSPLTRTRLLLAAATPDKFRSLVTSPDMRDLASEISKS